MAVEVADRLWVSDDKQNRDFIVSNVPSQAVPIAITAHDNQHKAVIASIVVESRPSSIAGPSNKEPIRMQEAREVSTRLRQLAVDKQEVVLAAARAAEEADRLRVEQDAVLDAERFRADEERRRLEEVEARAADQRRAEEEAAVNRDAAVKRSAEEAAVNQRRAEEEHVERLERCRAEARLEEEKRIEVVKRCLEEREKQELAEQAMQQGVQQQPLLHSRADAHPEQTAEADMEARRTVVLTNNALATHLSFNWFGPGLASAHLVQTLFRFPHGPHLVPNWFLLGSHPRFPRGSHLCGGGHVGTRWSQVGTWWGPPGGW